MSGKNEAIPGAFSREIAVMEHMRWSWEEYKAAPEPLINEIVMRMERSNHWQAEKQKRDEAERKRKARRK